MGEDDWFEQFREHLFGMRKAAYEFGQCDRPDDHERMLAEQRAIFAMIDALMFEHHPDIQRYEWLRKNFAALEFSREGSRLHIENGDAPEKLDILLDELRAATEAA